jgi:hypothetical protein
MYRTYNEWRLTALAVCGDLGAGQRDELKTALQSGSAVMINDTLLKIDASTAFVSEANPEGRFVHAQNHLGLVVAAAPTACGAGLDKAIHWAEEQLLAPDT